MQPTVSLCLFVCNDLAMLRTTLAYAVQWADQICILDMGSTDGTREFCESWLRPQDQYQHREINTCPRLGFAEARNAASEMASSDWIMTGAADTLLDWRLTNLIRPTLERATADVLSVETVNIPPFKDCQPHQIELAIASSAEFKREAHRCLLRRNSGVDFKGYIHEEPYRGETNCLRESRPTGLRRYHFHDWGNKTLRNLRYGWMFARAMKDPYLQRYTNRWWYDVFCKDNAGLIEQWRVAYEALKLPEMG